MQIDIRSRTIFDELISNPSITSKELEAEYDLTRRQLGYSFDKINNWLAFKSLPAIERTRQGHFIIDYLILSEFSNTKTIGSANQNIITEQQRVYLIIVMLLCKKEELSLFHFTSELDVSKNTVLSDLNEARKLVDNYDVTIRYSRKHGYLIEGEEFSIRKLLINIFYKIIEIPNGKSRIQALVNIKEAELNELRQRLEKIENKLSLKFTDEKIETMPYTLLLVLHRVKINTLKTSFSIPYKELSGTKEYQATEELLFDHQDIPMIERLFITLHLLTTNVYWSETLTDDEVPNLAQAVEDMLRLFEKSAAIYLKDREELITKILLHMKPAYYRIKYQLTEVYDISYSLIKKELKELHHLVSQSTKPLSTLIGHAIPESETAYLTMLIGGWLRRQGENLEEKTKAIVVCPKGVSVSRLMFSELRELFPEFAFLDSLSVRDFYNFELDFDVVFSPVFLETDKKLFLASSFLEREEKNRLRKQVMLDLHGYIPFVVNIDEILQIVKKHAVIEDEKSLEKELRDYVVRDGKSTAFNDELKLSARNLSDLLAPSKITLRKAVSSWEEAIRLCAKPIVESGHIKPEYVEAIINQGEKDPYIVIAPNVAIPHAAPEEGVNDVAMSLLRLEEGVKFGEKYIINLVVIIAAKDKQQHFRALTQLMKLAQSEKDRYEMIQSQSIEDIYDIIKKYSIDN
ncbi:BglG family transcription antiterminator [Sporosarcina jiandibaonis]|uniref:BglG family transcription antiterminator n=1 Tax=Sporosarcina jiandibaonis TaxID=2715535 RepID=UPI001552526E|nr:BglG family transcription antiterminator [Sporosarcina jiandibaonis]